MKYLLSALSFLLLPAIVRGQQNHVPNGSFEYYTSCPSSSSQIDSCVGWTRYGSGSADYFNACATNPSLSVPSNGLTYQYAHDGNAYVGGGFSIAGQNGLAEYITRTISPLSIGSTYEVSMSVNLRDNVSYGHSGIGMFLYKDGALSPKGREVLNLEVINAMGQVIYKDDITTENGKIYKEINLQQVPADVYMLRLSGGETNGVTRFSVR